MTVPPSARRIYQFGVFELDVYTRELRKAGVRLNVQDQPLQLLRLLLERPGELVTREELRQELWPSDTFVGFEHGLNAAVRRLRETLGDSADTPRFIETLPRRGYRFIGTIAGDGTREAVEETAKPVELPEPAARQVDQDLRKTPGSTRRSMPVVALVPVGAGIVLACWVAFSLGQRSTERPQPTFRQLTFRRGGVVSARFTPDGKTVVYGAAWDGDPVKLFSTRVEGPESSPLPFPDADVADISSAAELLIVLNRPYQAFLQPGTLARVPLGGGTPRAIAERVTAASWSPDHRQFAVTREIGEKSRVEYPQGTVIHDCYEARAPRVSRDGSRLAFYARETMPDDLGVAIAERTGQTRILSKGWKWAGRHLAWSPHGDEIWLSATRGGWDASLWAVSLSGRERPLWSLPGWTNLQDVAPDGRVLLTNGTHLSQMRCSPAGADAERDLSWFDSSGLAALSHDGRSVLFMELGNASPVTSVFLRRTDGSPPERLGQGFPASLSPDAKWVLAFDEKTTSHVLLLPTGPGQQKTLARPGVDWTIEPGWRDSQHLLVAGREPGHRVRTYALDVGGGGWQPVTPYDLVCTWASPDGARALCREVQGARQIYSFPEQRATRLPELPPRHAVIGWGADSDSVFVRTLGQMPIRIYRLHLSSGTRELVREIVPAQRAGLLDEAVTVQITPDGRSYCYSAPYSFNDLYLVEGLR
jgi:DNA-binding winged helix-turn-helix (wHTH) protein/Tol biopolymer transport system component